MSAGIGMTKEYGSSQTPITPPQASGEVEAAVKWLEGVARTNRGFGYEDAAVRAENALSALRNQDAEIKRLTGVMAEIKRRSDTSPTRTLGEASDELARVQDLARAAIESPK